MLLVDVSSIFSSLTPCLSDTWLSTSDPFLYQWLTSLNLHRGPGLIDSMSFLFVPDVALYFVLCWCQNHSVPKRTQPIFLMQATLGLPVSVQNTTNHQNTISEVTYHSIASGFQAVGYSHHLSDYPLPAAIGPCFGKCFLVGVTAAVLCWFFAEYFSHLLSSTLLQRELPKSKLYSYNFLI